MIDLIASIVMLLGALFVLVSCIGLHRFGDVFARLHSAGKSSTLGLTLVATGAAARLGDVRSAFQLGLIIVMAIVTIPVGVHLFARAAWRSGVHLDPSTVIESEIDQSRGNS